jgi:hypothetical protein
VTGEAQRSALRIVAAVPSRLRVFGSLKALASQPGTYFFARQRCGRLHQGDRDASASPSPHRKIGRRVVPSFDKWPQGKIGCRRVSAGVSGTRGYRAQVRAEGELQVLEREGVSMTERIET